MALTHGGGRRRVAELDDIPWERIASLKFGGDCAQAALDSICCQAIPEGLSPLRHRPDRSGRPCRSHCRGYHNTRTGVAGKAYPRPAGSQLSPHVARFRIKLQTLM